MRGLMLVAGAALSLAGCGKGEQTAGNVSGVENLTVETAPAADTTAIDAATSDDANMAAEAEVSAIGPATNAEAGSSGARNESRNSE